MAHAPAPASRMLRWEDGTGDKLLAFSLGGAGYLPDSIPVVPCSAY